MYFVLSIFCDCHFLDGLDVLLQSRSNFSLEAWLCPGPQGKLPDLRGREREWVQQQGEGQIMTVKREEREEVRERIVIRTTCGVPPTFSRGCAYGDSGVENTIALYHTGSNSVRSICCRFVVKYSVYRKTCRITTFAANSQRIEPFQRRLSHFRHCRRPPYSRIAHTAQI